jgi:hypothetical protein
MPGPRSGGSRRADDQTEKENIMLDYAADAGFWGYEDADDDAILVEDEMDAPESWDSGSVTFDPYV